MKKTRTRGEGKKKKRGLGGLGWDGGNVMKETESQGLVINLIKFNAVQESLDQDLSYLRYMHAPKST